MKVQLIICRNAILFSLLLLNLSFHNKEDKLWASDNNVIELRNNESGKEFFRIFVMPFPVEPAHKYILKSNESETWSFTEGNYNGRIYTEAPMWPVEIIYEKADGHTTGTSNLVFVDRNFPEPNAYKLVKGELKRDNQTSTLSREFRDYYKDREFIEAKRDEILRNAGLDQNSSDYDKVMAFAEYCYQVRKNTPWQKGRYLHPVDFCIHGDFCVGAANTLCAFCSTLDIPCRILAFAGHSTAEVFVEGQWRLAENALPILDTLRSIPGEVEKGPLFGYSFLEMIVNPVQYSFPRDNLYNEFTCLADERKGELEIFTEIHQNWIFHLYGLYKDAPYYNIKFSLGSSREIRLLYPGKEQLFYKTDSIPHMWLTPFQNTAAGENRDHMMVIDQNQAIRQTFYISSLENVKQIRAYLPVPQKFVRAMPEDGGEWYYRVNGNDYYVKDHGGWNIAFQPDIKRNCLMFDIPLEVINTKD